MNSDSAPLGAETRERIVRQFEAWLDKTLAAEGPPGGIAAEILAELEAAGSEEQPAFEDFYSMWAAVTALTQEVRLQGRAFRQLSEGLGKTDAVRERELERQAECRAQKEILDDFLDLRDRMARGLETMRAAIAHSGEGSRLARLFASKDLEQMREAVAAIEKGYVLGLERLDETLDRMGVRPIQCAGRHFDPETMSAIDIRETDEVAHGTVLEVFRPGWEWDGKVYRAAQVKVARAAGVDAEEEEWA